jgi:hypothetical protein
MRQQDIPCPTKDYTQQIGLECQRRQDPAHRWVAGDKDQVVICDAAERAKPVPLRREALEAMALKLPASFEAGLLDSGDSPAGVQ